MGWFIRVGSYSSPALPICSTKPGQITAVDYIRLGSLSLFVLVRSRIETLSRNTARP